VILDGHRVITANVGDSAALLCGIDNNNTLNLRSGNEWLPLSHVFNDDEQTPQQIGATMTASESNLSPAPSEGGPSDNGNDGGNASSLSMELTANHTPESEIEYLRTATVRPSRSGLQIGGRIAPDLLFVYDSLSSSKAKCAPIFESTEEGLMRKTSKGSYYKNVRSEWATLVVTPPHAAFQDALAFTRSLGDFHLQAYGVAHAPDVRWLDLNQNNTASASLMAPPLPPSVLAVVLASDGLWDNWKESEIASFVLNQQIINQVKHDPKGTARKVTDTLMTENLKKASTNFGDSADNMTILVTYLSKAAV
jgi:hypothetical protein